MRTTGGRSGQDRRRIPARGWTLLPARASRASFDIEYQRAAVESYFNSNPEKLQFVPPRIHHELAELEILADNFEPTRKLG
jgi:hypothetical protein